MEQKTPKNAVIGQSGGPTAAINATLAGVIRGCMNAPDIQTVYGMRNGLEGLLKQDLVALNDRFEDSKTDELLKMTPAAALGSCRLKLTADQQMNAVFNVLETYHIGYFFYIGGNDSMDAVAKLQAYKKAHPDVNPTDTVFIGVPKTIDNDLCLTDHTPGFGSAAKYVASSLLEMVRDCAVYQTKAVTIVEIMGRDAGWLTASAALCKDIAGVGADLIYLPEKPFDLEDFLEKLNTLLARPDKRFVIVAVSEGIRDKDGNYAAKAAMSGVTDTFGHAYLAGTGKFLENTVRERIGCKCRSVELNILQRCASHIASKTDIEESFRIGNAAVLTATSGKSGRMMAFVRTSDSPYTVEIRDIDVNECANKVKCVPDSYITADGCGISQEGLAYLRPLVQGECETPFENGLPKHFVL